MITKITNDNVSFFEKYISVDELDNLLNRPDYFGIGVTRFSKREEVPAGVLIYRINQDPTGLIPASITITHLYVAEAHRRRCVGSDLICRLFDVATRNKIETITADTYANDEHNGLREFLAGWHFDYTPVYSEEFISRIGDIDISPVVSKIGHKQAMQATDFGHISTSQFKEFKNNLRKNNTEGMEYSFYEIDKDYYDQKLSKVVVLDNKIAAALLVHKNKGGVLTVELLKWLQGVDEKDALGLIVASFNDAKSHYGDDMYISLTIRSDYAANLVDVVAPNHKTLPIFRGMLTKDTEVTSEDWMGAKEIMRDLLDSTLEEEE